MSDSSFSLNLDTSQYQQSMAQASQAALNFQQATSALTNNSKILRIALLGLVPGVGMLEKGFGGFTDQAAATQQQLSGLRATATVAGQSMGQLTASANQLARSFPIGNAAAIQLITQIQGLGIAGAGSEARIGALGTQMVKLAGATSSSLAPITQNFLQVSRAFGDTNLDPKRISRFGDSLTTLVAKFGGSAESISAFTKQISPFARQAGLGEGATLGIAAAFTKLGDDSGSAGTAVSKVLADIGKSVRDGTPQIATYASIVGKTADQFRNLAKANPTEALTQVVEALGNGVEGQRNIERLGFGDSIRTARALSELAQGGNLRSAIATSINNYGSGATDKASKEAFGGLNDSLTKLTSASEQAASAFGAPFLGPMTSFADALTKVTSGLGAFANSNVLQDIAKLIGSLAIAWAASKAVQAFGSGGLAVRIAQNNLPVMMSRAGRLIEEAGGVNEARAAAERRAAQTGFFGRSTNASRRGQMDLRALNKRDGLLKIDDDKRSGYQNFSYGVGEYSAAKTRTGAEDLQAKLAEAYAQYGETPQFYKRSQEIRDQANRGPVSKTLRRGFRVGFGGARAVSEAYGRFQDETFRVGDAMASDSIDPLAHIGAQGILRQPKEDFVASFKGNGPHGVGATGAVSGFTARLRDMTSVTIKAGKALHEAHDEESSRVKAIRIAAGVTAGDRAKLSMADRSFIPFLRTAGGLAGSALTSVGGLSTLGIAGAGMLWNARSSAQDATKQRENDISNLSITGVLDQYRDSVGKATGSTQTLADSVDAVSKQIQASVTDISQARKLTSADIATAESQKSGPIHRYYGTNTQIASQISGLEAGGLGPQELQAVKIDLYKQFGASRTQQLLNMVDTSGSTLASGPNGTGTFSGKYVNSFVAGLNKSYNSTGQATFGGRGVGGRGITDLTLQALHLDNSAHLSSQSTDNLKVGVEALDQQYQSQKANNGPAYAAQERMKSANAVIASLVKSGASEDVLRSATGAFGSALGVGASASTMDLNALQGVNPKTGQYFTRTFTDVLRSRSKDFSTTYNNLNSDNAGFSLGGPGLAGTTQMGMTGIALKDLGAYGSLFDNTKTNSASDLLNHLAGDKAGDATTQASAAQAVIDASKKMGLSLSDVADSAAKASSRLGDTGLEAQQRQLERARSLNLQSVNDQNGPVGQSLAHAFINAQNDANNTDATDSGQARRDASVQENAQALGQMRGMYQQRIQQNMDYTKQTGRINYDFGIQQQRQQAAFDLQMQYSEQDRNTSLFRTNRDYTQNVGKEFHDFYLSQYRAQRDFGIQMKRGAEDAARAMFDPYQRIAVEAIWDGRSLIQNLGDQQRQIKQQMADLATARKRGLSDATIQQLGLADASHAQELSSIVMDSGNSKSLIGDLNAAAGSKNAAATSLYNDPSNLTVQRAKQDFATSVSDQNKDFRYNMAFNAKQFNQSMTDQATDYTLQVNRAKAAFQLQSSQEVTDHKTAMDRMHTDLLDSQKTIDGDLASLQKLADRGLNASMGDYSKVMKDTVQATEDAIAASGINIDAIIANMRSGMAGVMNMTPGNSGQQYTTSGGSGVDSGGSSGMGRLSGSSVNVVAQRNGQDLHTYVTPGTGIVVGNPRTGLSGDSGQVGANSRPSTAFMQANPANANFNRSIAKSMMQSYGWTSPQEWAALDALWTQESNWNQYAQSGSSSAYGIPQSIVGQDMASAGSDWRTNPATQIKWGLDYIVRHGYGDPIGAEQHEIQYHNYARGGIATGPHLGMVAEAGSPEAMIPLNGQGVAVLAQAMNKYMTMADHKMMTTGNARTHIVYDNSHHWNDYSTKVMGEVTVVSDDPNEMGRMLAAKQRSRNLTATPTRRS